MQRDKNYEEIIEEIVERENKSGEMYRLGKDFKLDLDKINKMTKFDLYKGYDPKKGITKYMSDEDAIKIFYRRSDV